jgi:hypothetical protein
MASGSPAVLVTLSSSSRAGRLPAALSLFSALFRLLTPKV